MGECVSDRVLTAAHALSIAHPGRLWPCCEYVARIVTHAYGLHEAPGGPWWRSVNVWDLQRPWGGLEALQRAPGGILVDEPTPGRWHVAQGWRRLTPAGHVPPDDGRLNGHTWLWWALTPTHGLALESSPDDGPRYDGEPFPGPVRELCGPGEAWSARIAPYTAGVRLVRLPALPR